MKVKEILKTNNSINALNNLLNEMLSNFAKDLDDICFGTFPLINKYRPVIISLTQSYEKKFKQKCYITSYKNNELRKYIGRGKDRLSFSNDSFTKAMYYEVALLIAKYNMLHECQIKLAFMNMLLKNYFYYMKTYNDEYVLSFDINILKKIYHDIMETNIKDLPLIKDNEELAKNCFIFPEDDPDDYFNVDKPTKAQHLTMLFDDDMSQAEKLKIVAVHYECSERTAMRYMEKFGLWTRVRGTKTKKDKTPVPTVDSSFSDLSINGPKVTIK